jgi:beta-lactam-binding protein with PASTA domain
LASYVGLTYGQALALLSEASIPFYFRSSGNHDANATVVGQQPESGSLNYGDVLQITINEPNDLGNRTFGFVQFTLPDSPVPLEIRIIEHHAELGDLVLFQGELPTATISLPYFATPGSSIVLFVGGTPIASHAVD